MPCFFTLFSWEDSPGRRELAANPCRGKLLHRDLWASPSLPSPHQGAVPQGDPVPLRCSWIPGFPGIPLCWSCFSVLLLSPQRSFLTPKESFHPIGHLSLPHSERWASPWRLQEHTIYHPPKTALLSKETGKWRRPSEHHTSWGALAHRACPLQHRRTEVLQSRWWETAWTAFQPKFHVQEVILLTWNIYHPFRPPLGLPPHGETPSLIPSSLPCILQTRNPCSILGACFARSGVGGLPAGPPIRAVADGQLTPARANSGSLACQTGSLPFACLWNVEG